MHRGSPARCTRSCRRVGYDSPLEVVTEYGAVNLFGLSLRQRAQALSGIAHSDAREDLRRAFAETRHIVL